MAVPLKIEVVLLLWAQLKERRGMSEQVPAAPGAGSFDSRLRGSDFK